MAGIEVIFFYFWPGLKWVKSYFWRGIEWISHQIVLKFRIRSTEWYSWACLCTMFIDFFIGKCEDIRYTIVKRRYSFVVGNRGQKGTQSDSQLDEVPGQQLRQKVRYKKTKNICNAKRLHFFTGGWQPPEVWTQWRELWGRTRRSWCWSTTSDSMVPGCKLSKLPLLNSDILPDN